MTKKKRGHPDVDEILSRPWCFYCERDFDDLKILINHQKAKHFKCERCGRRLNTAGGLSVHMNQVHKENLGSIENALPNRAGLDIEIFGMEGIPEDVIQQHNQRVLTQFHQVEAERRVATGNPVLGSGAANATKKPKFESPADLKKRLAEHKAAKLAAEQNGGGSSGAATPSSTPAQLVVATETSTSYPGQPYPQPQSYAPPPSSTTFSAPHTYPQPPTPQYPPQGYPGFPQNNGYPAPSPQSPFGPPAYQHPYNQPPQPYQQMPPAFSPPPFQPMGSFPPPHQFSPQVPQNGYQSPVGAHRAFNSASPAASSFPPHQQRTHSPAHQSGQSRTSNLGLPSAPGLPQRPVVSAPPVNQAQFQQMHHGQNPVSGLPLLPSHGQQQTYTPAEYNPAAPHVGMPRSLSRDEKSDGAALDQLIFDAQRPQSSAVDVPQADKPAVPSDTATTVASKPEPADAKSTEKKDTDKKVTKATRLVYSDNEVSPEEKMAALPRYAFKSG